VKELKGIMEWTREGGSEETKSF